MPTPLPTPFRYRTVPTALAVLVVLGAGALAAGGLAVTAGADDGDGAVSPDGPVATAEHRDLRTTETVAGTVARADTTTVLHALPSGDAATSAPAPTGAGAGADTAGTAGTADVVTEAAAVGDEVGQGSVLYRADDQPVVSIVAADPLRRDLDPSAGDGADVLALEQALVDLGYGDGLTVDGSYTSATASAVEAWETDLGRAEPDGTVAVGEVVHLPGPARVLAHDAEVGDAVESGGPVLTLGSAGQVVEVRVDAAATAEWAPGTAVEVVGGAGTAEPGTVTEVGRDEEGGTVTAVVAPAGGGTGRPVGTEVEVVRTTARRDDALAVPVTAVVAGEGGEPAVRVVDADADADAGADVLTPVTLGVVADGWVEVTVGLPDEGGGGDGDAVRVRLPG